MGQRLVITLEKNETPIAAIYYHWSAYTADALYRTRDIIHCIYNHKDETDAQMLLRLLKYIEKHGGGIRADDEDSEHKYIQSLYPNETFKDDGYSRSDGLVALSVEGIESLHRWSEGDVYINIDTDTVSFGVYGSYESLEEYIEERKSWDDDFDETEVENIPKIDYEIGSFSIHDIDYIVFQFNEANADYVMQCGNEICELI